MPPTTIFLAPLAILAVALLMRRADVPSLARIHGLLAGRAAPWVFGFVSALIVWFVWGSIAQIGVFHDERAYLLQARIFASGRWVAAGRPLPEFFQQMHVLVSPVLAAKYAPGHALLLAPGALVGLPGLMPLVLTGLSGALVFALARRIATVWVALLTWLLWTTTKDVVQWHASYFSEVTTAALVLVAWWGLLRWRDDGDRHMLYLVAAAVGWGAITRPLTMLAFAIPIGVVVLRRTIARGAWRDLAKAAAIGTLILSILPLWSAATTGNWRETPLERYTREYLPFDRMGFGLDTTRAEKPLPRDLFSAMPGYIRLHEQHVPNALPGTLVNRLNQVRLGTWGGWLFPLAFAAVIGLLALGAESAFALGSAATLVVAYLVYAHPANWTLYYVEALPVLALFTALGVARVVSTTISLGLADASASEEQRSNRRAFALLALTLLAVVPAASDVRYVQRAFVRMQREQSQFRAAVEALPTERTIVFVRYADRHNGHQSLVENVPDLESARHWIVYDRGDANIELMRLAPDRTPYVADESGRTILPLQTPAATPPRE